MTCLNWFEHTPEKRARVYFNSKPGTPVDSVWIDFDANGVCTVSLTREQADDLRDKLNALVWPESPAKERAI